ncbi:MAG: TlpA family protein disulfide reductase [bacterium]|nr:TlpA family protein disulfide reductase [bacterium]
MSIFGRTLLLSIVIGLSVPAASVAKNLPPHISLPAPEWEISEWINSKGFKLSELKGKVVVIDFFQLWCPGCNSFSVPLMHKWEQKYADQVKAGKIQFVSIHTVFEGHNYQNPARLKKYLKEKGIEHPVGVDKQQKGHYVPLTMRRFNTKGTPEMAIIDKQGRIRFQRFGSFDVAASEQLIDQLLSE